MKVSSKTKEISLNLRKRIVDSENTGEGYGKLSKHFQGSRTEVRSIIKMFKERDTLQKKSNSIRNQNISNICFGYKTSERYI